MRFVLLVEGDTEKATAAQFLKRWLDPQLNQRVGINVVRFNGYAELLQKVVKKAQFYLDNPRNTDVVAVIGLLDLYGPDFYPGHAASPAARLEWAVNHIEREVDRQRFRMFFAVHEFEAWLLSQPDIFPNEVKRSLPANISHPETVNFNEPPSKLLNRVYKEKTRKMYKKTTYGRDLFAKLDPLVAVSKCPRLKAMLEEMLSMFSDDSQSVLKRNKRYPDNGFSNESPELPQNHGRGWRRLHYPKGGVRSYLCGQ